MTFYGKEDTPGAPAEEAKPLRKYTFIYEPSMELQAIEANFIRFEPHHVSFWLERTDPDSQATLVLAELHTNVLELREVTA